MAGKSWTAEEDERLLRLFGENKSNQQIAAALPGRSVKSISIRLSLKNVTSKSNCKPRGDDNLVGYISGKLTVVDYCGISNTGARLWNCRCDCGGTATVPSYHIKRKTVRSCGCLKRREGNPAWKGHERISSAFWGGYERGAKVRGITYSLNIEEGWDLYEQQQGKCFFTGQPIEFSYNSKESRHGTASLDRKDSSKGYTIDNCVWVHKDINRFKNKYSIDDFVNMCKMVASNFSEE